MRRSSKPCCYGREQCHGCRDHLHDGGSAVAGRKLSSGDFHSTLHSGWMFDKADIDGGSREQAARENSDQFSNLEHRSPTRSLMRKAILKQEKIEAASATKFFRDPQKMDSDVSSNRFRHEQ